MTIAYRFKSTTALNATSVTATFDESQPLSSNYSIFAVVYFSAPSTTMTGNSWSATALAASGNNGSLLYLGAFLRQANSSVNSFTVSFSSSVSVATIDLFAFSGYVSANLDTSLGTGAASASSLLISPTPATTVNNIISVASVGLNGTGTPWGIFGSGYEDYPTDSPRLHSGVKAFTTSGQTPSTTLSWTSSKVSRGSIWNLQGTAAPTGDTTPPQDVKITFPLSGSELIGASTLKGTATDVSGVTSFTFIVDGTTQLTGATLSNGVWSLPVDSLNFENGTHSISAKATDSLGNTGFTAATTSFSVNNHVNLSYLFGGLKGVSGLYSQGKKASRVYMGNTLLTLPGTGAGGETPTAPTPVTMDPAAPARVASFGPNGTHWPSTTPWIKGSFDFQIDAECNSVDIAAKIQYIVDNRPLEEKCVVWIKDGTWTGNGDGSGSKAVLSNLGDLNRSWNILVAPKNGYRAVTASGGLRFHQLKGIVIARLFADSLGYVGTDCQRFGWAQSTGLRFTLNSVGTIGDSMNTLYRAECVTPEARVINSDTWDTYANSGAITNVYNDGCYVAPTYRLAGSGSHVDTHQSAGLLSYETWRDSALWSSTNQADQVGSSTHLTRDHMLVVAGFRMLERYPLPATAGAIGGDNGANASNGAGQFDLIKDSIYVQGDIYGQGLTAAAVYSKVENTIAATSTVPPTPVQGAWIRDLSYLTWTNAQYQQICPHPTDAYLRGIWS